MEIEGVLAFGLSAFLITPPHSATLVWTWVRSPGPSRLGEVISESFPATCAGLGFSDDLVYSVTSSSWTSGRFLSIFCPPTL